MIYVGSLIGDLQRDNTATFHFLEGELDSDPGPGVAGFYEGPYYSYYRFPRTFSATDDDEIDILAAYEQLDEAIALHGPFDGVLGFSHGGTLAAGYLIHHAKMSPGQAPPFRCAIFVNSLPPFRMHPGQRPVVEQGLEGWIRIPVVNIAGAMDELFEFSLALYRICDQRCSSFVVHGKGHDVPTDAKNVAIMAGAIRKLSVKMLGEIMKEFPIILHTTSSELFEECITQPDIGEGDPSDGLEDDFSILLEDASMPIAVIGMGFRGPGDATDTNKLWQMMRDKREAWSPIPKERWNNKAFYHPDHARYGTINVEGGHFIAEDLSLFDAPFFNMTSDEAAAMDPQQRLLLEVTYEGLENAGIPLARVTGTKTSCFVGSFCADYTDLLLRDPECVPMYQCTNAGQSRAMMSNRVSHFFDLKGPSVTVDTACSGSLVALHLACQSLRTEDASMAIAAGVNLILSHEFMSTMNGRCHTFDEKANGYARGEAIACLILKPLASALRDGDTIRAIIRGTGSNQDGRTPGITLPSGTAQEALIRDVYARAGLCPSETEVVEAHGTGTQAGDPVEIGAIARSFELGHDPDRVLRIGSIKTNVGHLEGASGVAGVIKAIMMLENRIILPSRNFETPNSRISFEEWNLKVPQVPESWDTPGPHRVSVNSFGYGGSNAHVILEDALGYLTERGLQRWFRSPSQAAQKGQLVDRHSECSQLPRQRIFMISAFDELSCKSQVAMLREFLESKKDLVQDDFVDDLAFTLNEHRSSFMWKATVIGSSVTDFSVTGHSSGEIAAAYACGALSMQDSMAVAYFRGIAASQLVIAPDMKGAMIAIGMSSKAVQGYLERLTSGKAVVACINSPSSVTVSGDVTAVDELSENLKDKSVLFRRLAVDVAYHSHHMEIVAHEYLASIEHISPRHSRDPVSHPALRAASTLATLSYPLDFEAINFPRDVEFTRKPRLLVNMPSYRWNHTKSYWVEPRMSKTYRNRESPRTDLLGAPDIMACPFERRWRNYFRAAEIPWLQDHRIQSDIIFPAAGYIAMAIEAIMQLVKDSDPMEEFLLKNVRIRSALIVPEATGVEVMTSLRDFDKDLTDETDRCDNRWTEHCVGVVGTQTGPSLTDDETFVNLNGLATAPAASENSHISVIDIPQLYKKLHDSGLEYGTCFSNLTCAHATQQGICFAEVTIPDTRDVMPMNFEHRSLIHPCTLDSIFHAIFAALPEDMDLDTGPLIPVSFEAMKVSSRIQRSAGEILKVEGKSDSSSIGYRDDLAAILQIHSKDNQDHLQNGHMPLREGGMGVTEDIGVLLRAVSHLLSAFPLEDLETFKDAQSKLWDSYRTRTVNDSAYRAAVNYVALIGNKKPDIAVLEISDWGEQPYSLFLDELIPRTGVYEHRIPHCSKYTFAYREDYGLERARADYADWKDMVNFEKLDLNGDLSQQELSKHAYDVIVAPNAFYSTHLFRDGILKIKSLLKPGGYLIILNTLLSERSILDALLVTTVYHWPQSAVGFLRYGDRRKGEILREAGFKAENIMNEGLIICRPDYGTDSFDKKILVIRGDHDVVSRKLSEALQQQLPGESTVSNTIEALSKGRICIVLSDLERSSFQNPDAELLQKLKEIFLRSEGEGLSEYDTEYAERGKIVLVPRVVAQDELNRDITKMDKEDTTIEQLFQKVDRPVSLLQNEMGKKDVHFTAAKQIMELPEEYVGIKVCAFAISELDTDGSYDPNTLLGTIGFGCSGQVYELGPNVNEFSVGDRVACLGTGTARNYYHDQACAFQKIEHNISYELAASLPLAYTAAYYIIHDIARIDRGDMCDVIAIVFNEAQKDELSKRFKMASRQVFVDVEGMETVTDVTKAIDTVSSTNFAVITAEANDIVQASYLLVGGLGGIGRAIAFWMVEHGAKYLILVNRSGLSTETARSTVQLLRDKGVEVAVHGCDISDEQAFSEMYTELSRTMPPIKGVIQGAMILKDVHIERMTAEDYNTVLRPKFAGTWNLHNYLPADLDFFVMLSSISGVIGNATQSAYAAGSTFMDSFAAYRNTLGLPAVSLDLGTVTSVGYLAENKELAEKMVKQGFQSTDIKTLLSLVQLAISQTPTGIYSQIVTGLGDTKPRKSLANFDAALFSHFRRRFQANDSHEEGIDQAKILLENLRAAKTRDEAVLVVFEALSAKIAVQLSIPADRISPGSPLSEFGIDSTDAVELRNWIAKTMESTVPILEILASGSVFQLAGQIASRSQLLNISDEIS
ncbi:putative PKS/NRPS-like protein biosynthetic cluster [Penicillium ochrochloron]